MTAIKNRSLFIIFLFVFFTAIPTLLIAQVPARFYWHSLTGGKAVPLIIKLGSILI